MAAVFPGALVTLSNLFRASNLAQTTLAVSANDSTLTITVANGSAFVTPCLVVIDGEVIPIASKSGNVLTASSRGFDGTTATAHPAGSAVLCSPVAHQWNQLVDEMIAVQTALGVGLENVATTTSPIETRKATILRSDLTAAAMSQDITTAITIGQYEKVLGVTIKHTAAFAGGSVTSVMVGVGTSSDPTGFTGGVVHSIFEDASDSNFTDVAVYKSASMASGGSAVVVRFESTGANLSTLTGSATVDVWVTVQKLQ